MIGFETLDYSVYDCNKSQEIMKVDKHHHKPTFLQLWTIRKAQTSFDGTKF